MNDNVIIPFASQYHDENGDCLREVEHVFLF